MMRIAYSMLLAVVAVQMLSGELNAAEPARPNVLFIAVDDLRPALGCYGDEVAITPSIDALARRGTVFDRAYCQQALCCPSRLSLLSGRRPDTIEVWDLKTHFRDKFPNLVTLPQYFKNHGYHTQSIGKIFHGSGKPSKDPPSWSAEAQYDYVRDPKLRYALESNLQGEGLKRASSERADVPDGHYVDGIVCKLSLETLGKLKEQSQPFFLAVGFRKPHLPFCAPQRYWDLYDSDAIDPPASTSHPISAPEYAVRSWKELEGYSDIPEDGRLTEAQVRRLRHGYYACVSYVDALIGRLLERLDQLELRDNTVVVLWGDHGFHLGEQGLWTKANNYELSTRVPLIVASPGQSPAGTHSSALVEFVDVYPTLVELCGLAVPAGLEGISLLPLIHDPNRAWKQAVFSQHPRAESDFRHKRRGDVMGYAIRSDRFRYVEWRHLESKAIVARELYDHAIDPGETKNLAPELDHRETIKRMAAMLAGGWRASLPSTHRGGSR